MAALHKDPDKEDAVTIDGRFLRVVATNAAAQFFRPLTSIFEEVAPGRYRVRLQSEPHKPTGDR
ncbi:MAG TPA: hypothetical protein VN814_17600 [Caulobacteraceae bacterium]|nr:hypothetical protein [Caulobacteraceae bacterium]